MLRLLIAATMAAATIAIGTGHSLAGPRGHSTAPVIGVYQNCTGKCSANVTYAPYTSKTVIPTTNYNYNYGWSPYYYGGKG